MYGFNDFLGRFGFLGFLGKQSPLEASLDVWLKRLFEDHDLASDFLANPVAGPGQGFPGIQKENIGI